MATQETSSIRSKFEVLSKGAYLDILLPRSDDIDVSKALQDGSPEELARMPSRRNLFFGTRATFTILYDLH